MDRAGAMLDEIAENFLERLGRIGPDRDAGVAGIDSPRADHAFSDLELAPHLENPVQNLGQDERVDDMTVNLDLLDDAWAVAGG